MQSKMLSFRRERTSLFRPKAAETVMKLSTCPVHRYGLLAGPETKTPSCELYDPRATDDREPMTTEEETDFAKSLRRVRLTVL
jgi:hypothetical protein